MLASVSGAEGRVLQKQLIGLIKSMLISDWLLHGLS